MPHQVVKMYGSVVSVEGDVAVADITRPERINNVKLPLADLCLARAYPAHGSRVRISSLRAPLSAVSRGNEVALLAQVDHVATGAQVANPAYRRDYYASPTIAETTPVVVGVERWGVVPPAPIAQ